MNRRPFSKTYAAWSTLISPCQCRASGSPLKNSMKTKHSSQYSNLITASDGHFGNLIPDLEAVSIKTWIQAIKRNLMWIWSSSMANCDSMTDRSIASLRSHDQLPIAYYVAKGITTEYPNPEAGRFGVSLKSIFPVKRSSRDDYPQFFQWSLGMIYVLDLDFLEVALR